MDRNNRNNTADEEVLSNVQGEDTHNNNNITAHNNMVKVLSPQAKHFQWLSCERVCQ